MAEFFLSLKTFYPLLIPVAHEVRICAVSVTLEKKSKRASYINKLGMLILERYQHFMFLKFEHLRSYTHFLGERKEY